MARDGVTKAICMTLVLTLALTLVGRGPQCVCLSLCMRVSESVMLRARVMLRGVMRRVCHAAGGSRCVCVMLRVCYAAGGHAACV